MPEKHQAALPTARKIRRACQMELYRTAKKLKLWIPPDKLEQAEKLYVKRVYLNLLWIHENHSNRKKLADWWEENVSADIAELWGTDRQQLCDAFRAAFGG
jgi:toxin CptA